MNADCAAYRRAHFHMALRADVEPNDPCFDDGYFSDCFAMLDMIERRAGPDEIAAYDAASDGVFDAWRKWFHLTLAEMTLDLGRE